ncbi:MAG: CPC_1213 family protein [Eubacteriales bacterium]
MILDEGTSSLDKEDGKFRSRHIKHDPQAESARAVFGMKNDNPENKQSNNDGNIRMSDK